MCAPSRRSKNKIAHKSPTVRGLPRSVWVLKCPAGQKRDFGILEKMARIRGVLGFLYQG